MVKAVLYSCLPRVSLLAAVLTVPLTSAAVPADDDGNAGDRSTGDRHFGATELVFVAPEAAYCNGLATLRIEADATAGDDATIRWQADAGTLLYDDLEQVEWRLPKTPGPARISVSVSASRGVLKKDLTVDVRYPSTRDMIWIPPGTFKRGDISGTYNDEEVKTVQNSSDEPYHDVYLDGYWIDRYPVTNRQYRDYLDTLLKQGLAQVTDVAVMGNFEGSSVPFYYFQPYERLVRDYYETRNARHPSFRHILSWDDKSIRIRAGHEDHPIVDVTWFGAAAYAQFYGKDLPSEAEWEKAGRGQDSRAFPWGDNLPSVYHTNLEHARRDGLTPVGLFSPQGDSPYGVADMVSGCFEWTGDWFNGEYYEDYRAPVALRNPRGPFWGSAHTIRGFPSTLNYRVSTMDRLEPVSTRYHWEFEFLLGDSFANGETTFRTVSRHPRVEP